MASMSANVSVAQPVPGRLYNTLEEAEAAGHPFRLPTKDWFAGKNTLERFGVDGTLFDDEMVRAMRKHGYDWDGIRGGWYQVGGAA